ncbi:MAG: hypothetical protein KDA85_18020 [Planctomycetaceae bacterium]|nr:hypothetical protein [Planctomycetaceae bacterium]
MAFTSQRFIHAANVRLDVPVSVDTEEELNDELRREFEDATLGSFERVVLECVEHEVDFLLLSGNIFIEADRSLRARLALLHGFDALHDAGVTVFVIPGDSDPPEAWRAIGDLPSNVSVCYSSNPEPLELVDEDGQVVTTVSASAWYGETDSFGIRVIASSEGEHQPFRISVMSQAKYEEARRMAAVSGQESDELLSASMQNAANADFAEPPVVGSHGKRVSLQTAGGEHLDAAAIDAEADEGFDEDDVSPESLDRNRSENDPRHSRDRDGEQDRNGELDLDEQSLSELEEADASRHAAVPIHVDRSDSAVERSHWNDGFVSFVEETMHEGRLNYMAYMGELTRRSLVRDTGLLHCPGTTQPRNELEAECGTCSLVDVSETGVIRVKSLNTSVVDWKSFDLEVDQLTTLSSLLQTMKARLQKERPAASDRIWAVRWALRGNLAVLRELVENDLDVAVAVELDELTVGDQTIRLLHQIRSLPVAWELVDPKALGQQYLNLVDDEISIADASRLQAVLEGERAITPGWRQRLLSLIQGLDSERILSHLRSDGADWFLDDLAELTPAVAMHAVADADSAADETSEEDLSDESDFDEDGLADDDQGEDIDD